MRMVLQDLFDKWNVKFYKKGTENKIIFKIARTIMRKSANLILPTYLRISKRDKKVRETAPIIVSLTSFPARINYLWCTIETLKRQSVMPEKIILWLSKEQFPNGTEDLPEMLRDMLDEQFEIRFVEKDLRSHKKYIYSFKEFPDKVIVTVDDDIFYNSRLLEFLLVFHKKHPRCVICNRGWRIEKHSSYSDWEKIVGVEGPSFNILPTGVGGVLYPPHVYDDHIFDIDAIVNTCLRADDLWLNFMCRYKGSMIVTTGLKFEPIAISATQKEALCKTNNGTISDNDIQISNISKWTDKKLGVDFYCKIP